MSRFCKILRKYQKYIIGIALVALVVTVYLCYYYIERTVSFEYVMRIPAFKNCYPREGVEYVQSKKRMYFFLVDFYKKPSCQKDEIFGYDSTYVSPLIEDLDYEKYDYVISYMMKVSKLKYSPYLTDTEDGLYFDNRIPLIPEFEKGIYDFVYIYRVKKDYRFRAMGP